MRCIGRGGGGGSGGDAAAVPPAAAAAVTAATLAFGCGGGGALLTRGSFLTFRQRLKTRATSPSAPVRGIGASAGGYARTFPSRSTRSSAPSTSSSVLARPPPPPPPHVPLPPSLVTRFACGAHTSSAGAAASVCRRAVLPCTLTPLTAPFGRVLQPASGATAAATSPPLPAVCRARVRGGRSSAPRACASTVDPSPLAPAPTPVPEPPLSSQQISLRGSADAAPHASRAAALLPRVSHRSSDAMSKPCRSSRMPSRRNVRALGSDSTPPAMICALVFGEGAEGGQGATKVWKGSRAEVPRKCGRLRRHKSAEGRKAEAPHMCGRGRGLRRHNR
eukprot:365132-Chlamydomonas_euryale.AAC.1